MNDPKIGYSPGNWPEYPDGVTPGHIDRSAGEDDENEEERP